MITVGIDLAADPKKTGVAQVEWRDGKGLVTDVAVGASDEELVSLMASGDKTGIDCPLGWPVEFIEFITHHQHGHVEVVPGLTAGEWRKRLAYRVTDLRVKQLGLQGLSVSTDRIGVTTMRCAALLSQLAARDLPVDRAGAGAVVEVYPAASLRQWKLPHRGYKGKKGLGQLNELVDTLLERAEWLELGHHEEACRSSDDALDAVICAVTARAAAVGRVEPIPSEHLQVAAIEGWIALPDRELREVGSDIA